MSEIVFGEVYVPQSDPPNILTVGPFGFDNEPVLSPGLVLPTGIARVVSLVLKAYWFPTSTVRLAYFPWMLQTDVTLAALFLREVARLCRADWIFPTDSAGILVVAKLAVMLAEEGGKENELLLAALQRSMQWPPRYPPPHLSKLMPGHEQFSPPEAVVSESDELHFPQGPDRERVATAVRTVGAHSFAKREYSEASRGVARDDEGSVDSAFRAVQRVFARGAGVAAFDQSLKVAIFLQQEVPLDSGVMPVGVRFFAKAGKLIAAHSSESIETNVVYKTVRDETVEKRTIELLKVINYTGFGSAWWWRKDGNAYLTDFNARLERHACLNAVLDGVDLLGDPCYALQTGLVEEELYVSSGPHFVRAGIQYLDPIRAMSSPGPRLLQLVADTSLKWNIQKRDEALMKLVNQKMEQHIQNAKMEE